MCTEADSVEKVFAVAGNVAFKFIGPGLPSILFGRGVALKQQRPSTCELEQVATLLAYVWQAEVAAPVAQEGGVPRLRGNPVEEVVVSLEVLVGKFGYEAPQLFGVGTENDAEFAAALGCPQGRTLLVRARATSTAHSGQLGRRMCRDQALGD